MATIRKSTTPTIPSSELVVAKGVKGAKGRFGPMSSVQKVYFVNYFKSALIALNHRGQWRHPRADDFERTTEGTVLYMYCACSLRLSHVCLWRRLVPFPSPLFPRSHLFLASLLFCLSLLLSSLFSPFATFAAPPLQSSSCAAAPPPVPTSTLR